MKKQYGENNLKKGGIAEEIAMLKQRREARKAKEEQKKNPQVSSKDAAFSKMVSKKKESLSNNQPNKHITAEDSKIFVVVRKRPRSQKEVNNGDIDCISVINPRTIVHECKVQVDGITKYIEDHEFYFDNSFDENDDTNVVYKYTISPIINLILNQGIVTCFAYGQTGSGKTYTMKGIENLSIDDLFSESAKLGDKFDFYISFFEIYGGRLFDLLNNKNKLQVLDDKNGKVQIYGLITQQVDSKEQMHKIIEAANAIRITHNTVTNETSSRSHAICNIIIKEKNSKEFGKLSLVDLAGSERAEETQSNNRIRRAEGAEINKSLLALKECIRALQARKTSGNNEIHVPFRASKLTHVLRDSFVSKSDKSRIIMISCINPSYIHSNHSINTLRYSDRLKEQTAFIIKQNNNIKIKINNEQNKNNQNKKQKKEIEREKELEEINMNVFNAKDDILNDINFDERINLDDDLLEFQKIENNEINKKEKENIITPQKNMDNNSEKIIDEEMEDLIYLKKTVSKDGKFISDDFIKYHKLTDTIIQDEDDIINTHMEVVKQDAKLLTEEGRLISLIKGIGTDEDKIEIDEYIQRLDNVLDQKMNIYSGLQDKIDIYKGHLKEEDKMRKEYPQFFVDPADL